MGSDRLDGALCKERFNLIVEYNMAVAECIGDRLIYPLKQQPKKNQATPGKSRVHPGNPLVVFAFFALFPPRFSHWTLLSCRHRTAVSRSSSLAAHQEQPHVAPCTRRSRK
jgi:hypothetical protein